MVHFHKPLRMPEPRRSERRAGERAERLREVLQWPDRSGASIRNREEKRAAFARFQSRYAPTDRSRFVSLALVGAIAAAIAAAGAGFASSRHLVRYAEQPARYHQLVAEVEAVCQRDPCRFGWGGDRPTSSVASQMAALRVRSVEYEPLTATITLRGDYKTRSWLTYDSPSASPAQARARAHARARARAIQARAAEQGWAAYNNTRTPLGGGWAEVRR